MFIYHIDAMISTVIIYTQITNIKNIGEGEIFINNMKKILNYDTV